MSIQAVAMVLALIISARPGEASERKAPFGLGALPAPSPASMAGEPSGTPAVRRPGHKRPRAEGSQSWTSGSGSATQARRRGLTRSPTATPVRMCGADGRSVTCRQHAPAKAARTATRRGGAGLAITRGQCWRLCKGAAARPPSRERVSYVLACGVPGLVPGTAVVQDTDSLPPSGWLCGPSCTQ